MSPSAVLDLLGIIVAVGAGTYVIRAGSLILGGRIRWPDWMRRWLTFVTPAVLGALIGPSLVSTSPVHSAWLLNPALWAALPTILVALRWRHLLGTVATGVVAYAIAVYLLPAAQ